MMLNIMGCVGTNRSFMFLIIIYGYLFIYLFIYLLYESKEMQYMIDYS